MESKRAKRRNREGLSAPSLRFALCYELVGELDRFSKNRIARHAEESLKLWRKLLPMLAAMFNPLEERMMRPGLEVQTFQLAEVSNEDKAELMDVGIGVGFGNGSYRSMFPQVDILRLKNRWFRLDKDTSEIVSAFNSLSPKVSGRIKDKKDLVAVAGVLQALSVFLYTEIPELSDIEPGSQKEIASMKHMSLKDFSSALQDLPPYNPEPTSPDNKERVASAVQRVFGWTVSSLSHENLVVKFCAWWLLIQSVVILTVLIAFRYLDHFKVDSAVFSLIVGTPLLVSAAALASPIRPR